jgi:hypothetical protein
MAAGRLFDFHGEVSFWLCKKVVFNAAQVMRVGVGVSRSELDRCYRGNNRVILDRAYGRAALLIRSEPAGLCVLAAPCRRNGVLGRPLVHEFRQRGRQVHLFPDQRCHAHVRRRNRATLMDGIAVARHQRVPPRQSVPVRDPLVCTGIRKP